MTTATATPPAERPPKAFAVWFKELERWDVDFFRRVQWAWPEDVLRPLGDALERKIREMPGDMDKVAVPIIEKISFGGAVSLTCTERRLKYKGRLFWAEAGELVYSKIRVKQGSLAVVPASMQRIAVSSEYPVYAVDSSVADGDFLLLVLRSHAFHSFLEGLSHGGSTKTRLHPTEFERLTVPLPPLPVQQAIVEHWNKAQQTVAKAQARAGEIEAGIAAHIYDALGSPAPNFIAARPKVLAIGWADLGRWSFNYVARQKLGLLGFSQSKYPIRPMSDCLAGTMNGYCIRPVSRKTPHRMLKLNALTPAGLDLEQTKFVKVSQKVANRFSLHRGDVLICRSVGSYEYVAKTALVGEDHPDILFPDIIIRAQFTEDVLPEYAREIMETPLGRSFFQSNARTAVGMWKIGAEDIRAFPIPVPPKGKQQAIVDMVQQRRAEIAAAREQAQQLAEQTKAEVEAMVLGKQPVNAEAE